MTAPSSVTPADLLRDAFGRVPEELPGLLEGLDAEALLWRADAGSNPIAWLVWHLTRVQDDHLAGVGEVDQVWHDGWAERFALPYDPDSIGYGHSSADVGAFGVGDAELLLGYQAAVHEMTLRVLDALDAAEDGPEAEAGAGWTRVVDEHWDPPVTAAVRVVSVVGDVHAHLGQIGFVRGLWERAH